MDAESSNLRREISHPAHLHAGPLILSSNYAGGLALILGQDGDSCSICGNHLREQVYIYRCPDANCDFKLDVSCSSIKSVIEFSGHGHHPLCLVQKPGPGIICRSCRHGSSNGELPIFRCGECGFSLHFLCGPLPRVVDYKGYELMLTDSLLDGADAEDCWCHICEEQRDPAQCVYHSDIGFTASIDCLLPQIKLALGGDLGEVELRTVGGYVPGKVIVKDQVGEDMQVEKAESEIQDDEGVGEAASSTIAQEASANSVLSLIDDTTNLALTSLLTMACEQWMTEAMDPDRAMSNMCVDVLTSMFAELSKQFTEHLHLNNSNEEANFNVPNNRVYDGGAVEEAEISTRTREVLESFPLLSRQVLCSLTEEKAQELDDAFNTIAGRISKAKVDADIPSLDVLQWYKEKADISHLEGDVWSMKHENEVGTEEASELPPLTFIKVMRSLTSEDTELIEDAFSKCTKGKENTGNTMGFLFYPYRVPPEQWDFRYSDEDFKQFKEHLDRTDLVNDSYIMGWKRYALNVVKVGENTVPSHFVPIHQELVERYGDFSVDSRLSPHAKALLFHILYTVVYSMRETQVLDITDDLLCTWQFYLRVVKNVGFNIQFALDNLENLVRAYFGLKVMKFRDDASENLGKQIEELSRQTLEKENRLRELKAIQERYRRLKEAEESLVKQSLIEAAEWKWKDVGDLIL